MDGSILDAGARAFARAGFHAATLEQIAEEAGVSRVTLHRRGIGKADVLAGLVARATEDYRARMWPVLTATGPVPGRLRLALSTLCEAAEANLGLMVAIGGLSDGIFHDEDGPDGADTREVYTEPLVRLLHEGHADGSLVAPEPEALATVLFNTVGWSYVHLRTGHRWPPERALASVVDVVLLGVVNRGEQPAPD